MSLESDDRYSGHRSGRLRQSCGALFPRFFLGLCYGLGLLSSFGFSRSPCFRGGGLLRFSACEKTTRRWR